MASINSIWASFAESIPDLEALTTGFAYVLGIGFIIYSLSEFRDLADRSTKHAVKGGFFEPIAYLLGGSVLLWLPSWLSVFEATLFGSNSPLAYSGYVTSQSVALQSFSSYDIYDLLQLMGIIFFVRGVSLMTLSSDPGVQHGFRGFIFMVAGVLAINFPATFELIESTISSFVSNQHILHPIQETVQSQIQSSF